MNKKILFLFTLVLLPVMAVAQHRVEGVVTDADTGEPLPSANILVKGTYSGTITNNDGRFLLDLEELPATLVTGGALYRVPIGGNRGYGRNERPADGGAAALGA